jgi:aryl-alcohol dehydrogenase-like predicted oxidoreductase
MVMGHRRSWGGDAVFGNYLTDADLKPVFDSAMDAGFNLWDTAAVYGMGASETILGSFTKSRNVVLISTKFTPQIAGENDNAVEELLDGSLKRLGLDHADIYWIHNQADKADVLTKLEGLIHVMREIGSKYNASTV